MKLLALVLIMTATVNGQSANKKTMNENKTNPLLCDPETGLCELPLTVENLKETAIEAKNKPVKIIYYTDPICSSCWGIEPQLRKLKLEYGDYFEIDYRMGGLLPDWSYSSGGISKPSDVAHHWDEASLYYEMPIDGDVWIEDPLESSYPSCIAMKAAQIQDKEKAVLFMRILREKLYLEKKNIAKWENIFETATLSGLNIEKLKVDYAGDGKANFQKDLEYARELGVRGFPTLFFADESGNKLTVNGSKPYQTYENVLLAMHPEAVKKEIVFTKDPLELFKIYPTLSAKEYAVILDKTTQEATAILEQQLWDGLLSAKTIKTGKLYMKK